MTTAAPRSRSDSTDSTAADPRLDDVLRYALAIGVVLVLLVPGARGFSDTFGWLPLWLLAMPLSAWWALHRFRLHLPADEQCQRAEPPRRRRIGAQARRRGLPASRRRQPQAA